MKEKQEIGGVWVRTHRGKIQVMVETGDGIWRQVFLEPVEGNTISHIVEPQGIRNAAVVNVLGDFEPLPF